LKIVSSQHGEKAANRPPFLLPQRGSKPLPAELARTVYIVNSSHK
jgi:hypothetical protein